MHSIHWLPKCISILSYNKWNHTKKTSFELPSHVWTTKPHLHSTKQTCCVCVCVYARFQSTHFRKDVDCTWLKLLTFSELSRYVRCISSKHILIHTYIRSLNPKFIENSTLLAASNFIVKCRHSLQSAHVAFMLHAPSRRVLRHN